jgi:hypothetical protein
MWMGVCAVLALGLAVALADAAVDEQVLVSCQSAADGGVAGNDHSIGANREGAAAWPFE